MTMGMENQKKVTRYVRYSAGDTVSYGILDGETIHGLHGDMFRGELSGKTSSLSSVRLLAPCDPSKVLAIGQNYKSHLGDRPTRPYPGVFAKLPTCIIGPGDKIVFPPEATDVHYEAEMVVVIGKKAARISKEEAPDHIFGVTAGNDVSERAWQKNDLQWFRAKASDTFGPIGPAIVQGLNYNDLLVECRLNGEVRQSQRTRDLLFDVDTIVSYISQFVTLLPGDLIFTGTPGHTKPMKPGDLVEVEVEGVGILRNQIAENAQAPG
jgi:2-keto-4-pentenoate hydratase/2-oxohepta-3-ene-1,7-dioic acid hydratase in catechol pathway